MGVKAGTWPAYFCEGMLGRALLVVLVATAEEARDAVHGCGDLGGSPIQRRLGASMFDECSVLEESVAGQRGKAARSVDGGGAADTV